MIPNSNASNGCEVEVSCIRFCLVLYIFCSRAFLNENSYPFGYLYDTLQYMLSFEHSILSAKYVP